jgi:hypothetical protein
VHIDAVIIREGDVTSYVEGLIENRRVLEGLPEQMGFYSDYARLARDMQYNGDASELQYNGNTDRISGGQRGIVMRLTAHEIKTLRELLLTQLVQMREAERAGMDGKLTTYQARLDVLGKVIDSELIEARDELVDEARRITIRMQEGRY